MMMAKKHETAIRQFNVVNAYASAIVITHILLKIIGSVLKCSTYKKEEFMLSKLKNL